MCKQIDKSKIKNKSYIKWELKISGLLIVTDKPHDIFFLWDRSSFHCRFGRIHIIPGWADPNPAISFWAHRRGSRNWGGVWSRLSNIVWRVGVRWGRFGRTLRGTCEIDYWRSLVSLILINNEMSWGTNQRFFSVAIIYSFCLLYFEKITQHEIDEAADEGFRGELEGLDVQDRTV